MEFVALGIVLAFGWVTIRATKWYFLKRYDASVSDAFYGSIIWSIVYGVVLTYMLWTFSSSKMISVLSLYGIIVVVNRAILYFSMRHDTMVRWN